MGFLDKIFKKDNSTKATEEVKTEVASEIKEESQEVAQAKPKLVLPEGKKLVIKIFCAGGFSTSLWALKTQEALQAAGVDASVTAYPVASIETEGAEADAILIGPQTRYVEKDTKKAFPDKIIEVVPFTIFGRVDGPTNVEFLKEIGVLS